MNFSEFKGWMEGIEASFKDGRPSVEQWKQIRNKLVNVYPDVQYIPPAAPLYPTLRQTPPFLPTYPYWTATSADGNHTMQGSSGVYSGVNGAGT